MPHRAASPIWGFASASEPDRGEPTAEVVERLAGADSVGVYLHIPFCAARCDYCAFATWTDRLHLAQRYLDACRAQARGWAPSLPPVDTVFVGGGTPSLVDPSALLAVLAELPVVADAEVTVECNPDDVSTSLFDTYVAGGVNRVSIGVQSMVPHVLASLGRTHTVANVETAVEAARRCGVGDVNLDLIYGAVGEREQDWRRTLDEAVALRPDHVSAYGLTVEAGTALADDPARHPDDDDQASKYLLADASMTSAGLVNYEISNWSRPGHECRHNLRYWRQGHYVGLGCAAHSHVGGRRWWSVRTPERFVDLIDRGASTVAGSEELDPEASEIEGLQLRIRTVDGVPAGAVPADVAHLVDVDAAGTARLNRSGRLLANEVAVRLEPTDRH